MKKTSHASLIAVVIFIIAYSFFVFYVQIGVSDYSDIIVATTFFFTLFIGFFISRQNDRYSDITEIIAERDGLYSFLYRVYGLVPRVQNNLREIIRNHYQKILDSDDWAYNEFHPSDTISRITKEMGGLTKEEEDSIDGHSYYDGIWDAIKELQQNRKKIIASYGENLAGFQWTIIYVLGVLLAVAFDFVPGNSLLVQILKILFGTAVFISIVLLKELDDLTLFGEHAGEKSAQDIFRIIDEKDAGELGESGKK
jgi:hypothetical protein